MAGLQSGSNASCLPAAKRATEENKLRASTGGEHNRLQANGAAAAGPPVATNWPAPAMVQHHYHSACHDQWWLTVDSSEVEAGEGGEDQAAEDEVLGLDVVTVGSSRGVWAQCGGWLCGWWGWLCACLLAHDRGIATTWHEAAIVAVVGQCRDSSQCGGCGLLQLPTDLWTGTSCLGMVSRTCTHGSCLPSRHTPSCGHKNNKTTHCTATALCCKPYHTQHGSHTLPWHKHRPPP